MVRASANTCVSVFMNDGNRGFHGNKLMVEMSQIAEDIKEVVCHWHTVDVNHIC